MSVGYSTVLLRDANLEEVFKIVCGGLEIGNVLKLRSDLEH